MCPCDWIGFLLLVFLFRAAPGIYLKARDNKGRGEKQEMRASHPVVRFIGFSPSFPVIIPVTCHTQDTGRESFYRKIGFPSFPPLLLGNFILKYKLTQKEDSSLSRLAALVVLGEMAPQLPAWNQSFPGCLPPPPL